MDWVTITVFIALIAWVTVLGFIASRRRRGDLGLIDEWGAGRPTARHHYHLVPVGRGSLLPIRPVAVMTLSRQITRRQL